jgi:hypothetical protein
MAFMLEEVEVA